MSPDSLSFILVLSVTILRLLASVGLLPIGGLSGALVFLLECTKLSKTYITRINIISFFYLAYILPIFEKMEQ